MLKRLSDLQSISTIMANSTSTTTDSNGLYHYDPSKTAAIIAAGLFGLSATFHLFQMIRKKTWFYTPMTIGAFSKLPPSPHFPKYPIILSPFLKEQLISRPFY